ncbi:MAG: hypothetical protein WD602_02610 [Actinomycetota bacterium]
MSRGGSGENLRWAGWIAGLCVACCALPLLVSAGALTAWAGVRFGGLAAAAVLGVAAVAVMLPRRRSKTACELEKRGEQDEPSRDRILR